MSKRIGDEYKCDSCGGVFETTWSEDEAEQEAQETFGEKLLSLTGRATVCDDCYKAMGLGREIPRTFA